METLATAAEILRSFASFAVIISIIVFVHEFGHYFVARRAGVRVLAFAIGFGKELVGYTDKHGTRWKICMIPMGGYVKMFGDTDATSLPDSGTLDALKGKEREEAFHFKPLRAKTAIVFAGPFINFVFGILLLTALYTWQGRMVALAEVAEVLPGGAAAEAGIQPGDAILEIEGEKVRYFSDVQRIVTLSPGKPLRFTIRRGEAEQSLTLTPQRAEAKNVFGETREEGRIGIVSHKMEYQAMGLPEAFTESLRETWHICYYTPIAIGEILMGERDAKDIGGPVRIAKYSGESTQKGFTFTLWFMAMLSINLGLINLFPIPPLDGGHLMYYGIEAIRGRPMAERFQEYGFRAGFALLLALMLFATVNDIMQFDVFK